MLLSNLNRFAYRFAALPLLLSLSTMAARAVVAKSAPLPYYGAAFYENVSNTESAGEDLKAILYDVLKKPHVATPGALDELVETCPSELRKGQSCVERKVLSYRDARVELFGRLHLHGDESSGFKVEDVYCQKLMSAADFGAADSVGPGRIPPHEIVNTEHTWPQSRFNANEHRESQLTDLHHLFPTDSKLNAVRGNHRFGEVIKEGAEAAPAQKCPGNYLGKPKPVDGIAAPGNDPFYEVPLAHRGNLARSLFYFSVRYRAHIHPLEEHYLRKWHVEDPVDEAERARNDAIYGIQKTRNPFIDFPQLVDRIPDFKSAHYVSVKGEGSTGGRSGSSDRPRTPRSSTPPASPPADTAVLAPHSLVDGVLTVVGSDNQKLHEVKGIVEARRHPCTGSSGVPYNSFELFARDGQGTLYRFKAGGLMIMSQERVAPDLTLADFIAAENIRCPE